MISTGPDKERRVASRLRIEFQPEELDAVLEQYDLGHIVQIDKQIKGSRRSPKLVITCDHGKYLLKRRARGRDHPLKVAYAHAVQQFLANRHFPIPALVPTRDGISTMVILDELIYEMFSFVEGITYNRSTNATFDAGRVLGMFHDLLVGYHSDWEPSRRGYHDSHLVRSHLQSIPAGIGKNDSVVGHESELLGIIGQLFDVYEKACDKVNAGGFVQWPAQIVHADWHPGNMLFLNDKVSAVIDYDSLHTLPAITDLANGLLQFSILGGSIDPRLWPPQLDEERFKTFHAGYRKDRPSSSDQGPAIPWLMIEALIAEAVTPIAATGSFGHIEGFRFLKMINRKVRWLQDHAEHLIQLAQH